MRSPFTVIRSRGCLQLLLLQSSYHLGLASSAEKFNSSGSGVFSQVEAVPQFAARTSEAMSSSTANGAAQGPLPQGAAGGALATARIGSKAYPACH